MRLYTIGEYASALFGEQSYISKETGEISSIIKLKYFPDGNPMMKLDNYSMGHVRQQFMRRQHYSREELDEYGLDGWEEIPLEIASQTNMRMKEYISLCHRFCEDHHIEDDFWTFFDEYSKPIVMAWCEKTGFPYAHGDLAGQALANPTKKAPKTNHISKFQAALFTTPCHIGLETGEIYLDVLLEQTPDLYPVKEPLCQMDYYSMGHVRQQFMKSIHVPENDLMEYCLYEIEESPLLVTRESDDIGMDYVVKSQKYLEDHGLLDDFWEFYDTFTKPIAMKWCQENGFLYKDDGNHLLKWSEAGSE